MNHRSSAFGHGSCGFFFIVGTEPTIDFKLRSHCCCQYLAISFLVRLINSTMQVFGAETVNDNDDNPADENQFDLIVDSTSFILSRSKSPIASQSMHYELKMRKIGSFRYQNNFNYIQLSMSSPCHIFSFCSQPNQNLIDARHSDSINLVNFVRQFLQMILYLIVMSLNVYNTHMLAVQTFARCKMQSIFHSIDVRCIALQPPIRLHLDVFRTNKNHDAADMDNPVAVSFALYQQSPTQPCHVPSISTPFLLIISYLYLLICTANDN